MPHRIDAHACILLVALHLAACGGPKTVDTAERGLGPANVVPANAQPIGRCDDATLLTLEQLADLDTYDATRIAIDVVPMAQVACTEEDCEEGNHSACCNSCGGDYVATLNRASPARRLEVRFTGIAGCSGMDCNYHCEPFGLNPTTTYRIVGRAKQPRPDIANLRQVELAVQTYCLL